MAEYAYHETTRGAMPSIVRQGLGSNFRQRNDWEVGDRGPGEENLLYYRLAPLWDDPSNHVNVRLRFDLDELPRGLRTAEDELLPGDYYIVGPSAFFIEPERLRYRDDNGRWRRLRDWPEGWDTLHQGGLQAARAARPPVEPLFVGVPDDPRFHGDRYAGQHMTGGREPQWVWDEDGERGHYTERVEANREVPWVRGTPIPLSDPRLPETVYHVTTNYPAVLAAGRLKAGGAGGLGGDANDRIVSFTTDPELARSIERDIKLVAHLARTLPPEPPGASWEEAEKRWVDHSDHAAWSRLLLERLKEVARGEGWDFTAAVAMGNQDHIADSTLAGYRFQEWLWNYFSERSHKLGRKDPLFQGAGQTPEHWAEINPDWVQTVALPLTALDTGAMVSDLDLGQNYGLSEIRVYGDVPLHPGADPELSSRCYQAVASEPPDRQADPWRACIERELAARSTAANGWAAGGGDQSEARSWLPAADA